MKQIRIIKAITCLTVAVMLFSCTDEFLKTPGAEIQVYVKNETGELVSPGSIIANETKLYFANTGVSFFSVVYPGEKLFKEEIVDDMGETYSVWTENYDYNDINRTNYIDSTGKRAVKGIPLAYKDSYTMFLSQSPYVYKRSGEFTVHLEARNTNEDGEVSVKVDSLTILVTGN